MNQKLPCTLKFLLHVASQFNRAIIILKHQLLVDTSFVFGPDMPFCNNYKAMDHIGILGIGLELACNGGSCGGISLQRDQLHLHLKRPPA